MKNKETKKEVLVKICPCTGDTFILGIPVSYGLTVAQENEEIDRWIAFNTHMFDINHTERMDKVEYEYEGKFSMDAAQNTYTVYEKKGEDPSQIYALLYDNTPFERLEELTEQVVWLMEDQIAQIGLAYKEAKIAPKSRPWDGPQYIVEDDYSAIYNEVRYVVRHYRLDTGKLMSKEAVEAALNVILRPFFRILAAKGWDKYYYPWTALQLKQNIEDLLVSWDLVQKQDHYKLTVTYSSEELEGAEANFPSEEEAWDKAKDASVNELKEEAALGRCVKLNIYPGAKQIELTYMDGSKCQYQVNKI